MNMPNLQSKEFHNNAHTLFAAMRRDQPVTQASFRSRGDVYLVTRYADVEELLQGDRLVKDPTNSTLGAKARRVIAPPKMLEGLMSSMLTSDDPEHRRLRKLVSKAFTPRTISALEASMETLARDLIKDILERKQVDLIEAFALPFPIHIITELVGVPKEDRPRFQRWVHRIVQPPTMINSMAIIPALIGFSRYVRKLANEKRANPGEDLLSLLVQVEEEDAGLSDDELVSMMFLLLVAGHETTVSLIANGTLALLTHREEFEKLRNHRELLGSAIEEMLRFDGPLLTTDPYYARETMTLHGVTIPAGATVLPAVLSANRDEERFEAPDHFDITRSPNKHFSFGKGIHHCLGAAMTRQEARIAFSTLLEMADHIELGVPVEKIRYRPAMFLHRLTALPVSVR